MGPNPLSIAFFGSDSFSLASLKALNRIRLVKPELLSSLIVVTRELKPSGRGQNTVHRPDIVEFAHREKIEWKEIKNVQDYGDISKYVNLAVAVSYGELIPSFFLSKLYFGGLNVHPSLLPSLRGAAPIQWSIMRLKSYTGVSVQTLHPSRFDHGKLLWTSPKVPISSTDTFNTLREKLSQIGADGLKTVIEENLYINQPIIETNEPASWAPLIDKKLSQVNLDGTIESEMAKGRALEKLHIYIPQFKKGAVQPQPIRVILSDFINIDNMDISHYNKGDIVHLPLNLLGLVLSDGILAAKRVQVATYKEEDPDDYFSRLRKRGLRLPQRVMV